MEIRMYPNTRVLVWVNNKVNQGNDIYLIFMANIVWLNVLDGWQSFEISHGNSGLSVHIRRCFCMYINCLAIIVHLSFKVHLQTWGVGSLELLYQLFYQTYYIDNTPYDTHTKYWRLLLYWNGFQIELNKLFSTATYWIWAVRPLFKSMFSSSWLILLVTQCSLMTTNCGIPEWKFLI